MRLIRLSSLAAAVALVLAGCGTGAPSGDNDQVSPLKAEDFLGAPCADIGVRPDGDKEFTYWSMWNADEPQGRVLSKVIRCFTDKTGVKVNVQWLGRDLLRQNVVPALATGAGPDLFDQDVSQVKGLVADAGGTRPVDDVLDLAIGENEQKVRDVLPAAYFDIPQNKASDGKIFEIPYMLLGNSWWYDKNRITDFSAPTSDDELFALFDKAKGDGLPAVAQDNGLDSVNAAVFAQVALRYVGAGKLSEAAQDKTGDAWRNNAGLQRAADLVERFAKGNYLLEGWENAPYPKMRERWAAGEAAYLFGTSEIPAEARQLLSQRGGDQTADFAPFRFPQPSGASHDVVEYLPVGFAIPAKAKRVAAAKAFIAYTLNRDNLTGFPSVADSLAVRADLPVPAVLSPIRTALYDTNAEHALVLDGTNAIAGGRWISEVLNPLHASLLKGNMTAAQFTEAMAAKQADFWRGNP
ncbi:ABC transporter substrate-binding protein [Actinokineospora auranticolor]|uniref:Raffinose/stachyose/melibiose transport system substrate-binding protein n=1 Tax=Actinokineospora auranticolor TaxID=155976 RepID=A0A2S6GQ90_9PSEU|nr:ABC transporter substrate-binding protein [Actinokineospora auranticolor]PPK67432.1 raffinose/stachyose/melibiose transport system substrate-binding protein [Actinokineospora auranticolor]